MKTDRNRNLCEVLILISAFIEEGIVCLGGLLYIFTKNNLPLRFRRYTVYNCKDFKRFSGMQGKKMKNILRSRQMHFHWIREGFKLSLLKGNFCSQGES